MDQTQPWVFERASVDTREEQRAVIVDRIKAPVMPQRRSSGRRWQPDSITITIERYRKSVGPWTPWRVVTWRIEGFSVKADGTTGARRFERFHDWPEDSPPARYVADLVVATVERGGMPLPIRLGEAAAEPFDGEAANPDTVPGVRSIDLDA